MTLPEIFKTNSISIDKDEQFALQLINCAMQSKMIAELKKTNKYFSSMAVKTTKSFYAIADTTLKEMVFNSRVMAVDVDNNGPGNLYVKFNELDGDITSEIPIPAAGGTGIASAVPSIKRMWYQATAANTQIEIYIEEGYGEESSGIPE